MKTIEIQGLKRSDLTKQSLKALRMDRTSAMCTLRWSRTIHSSVPSATSQRIGLYTKRVYRESNG